MELFLFIMIVCPIFVFASQHPSVTGTCRLIKMQIYQAYIHSIKSHRRGFDYEDFGGSTASVNPKLPLHLQIYKFNYGLEQKYWIWKIYSHWRSEKNKLKCYRLNINYEFDE